jgi:hypothetical protein
VVYALKDNSLIECYLDALKLKLDSEFIEMLKYEITRRGLSI